MDPRATVKRFCSAVEAAEEGGDDEDWQEARDAAIELHEWLEGKGFPPSLTKKEQTRLWRAIANCSANVVGLLRGDSD